jgi:hypothetical protein
MRPLISCSLAVALGLITTTGRAEGLLRRLPDDGTWVRYVTQSNRDGESHVEEGSLTISSVGRVTEGNDTFRWIEYKLVTGGRTILMKFLVPEKQCKTDGRPLQQALRCWNKYGAEVSQVNLPLGGEPLVFLSHYLPGPLNDTRKFDKKVVESGLGALECETLRGRMTALEKFRFTYTLRLHKNAPFGVVSCRSVQGPRTTTLKLVEIGKDAESALPSYL